jgi:predicted kinase
MSWSPTTWLRSADRVTLSYSTPTLLLVAGIPGAGKSTLLTRAAPVNCTVLHADGIRGEVQRRHGLPEDGYHREHIDEARQIFFERLDDALLQRRCVIVDATLMTDHSREELVARAGPHPHALHMIIIEASYEDALHGTRQRTRPVPERDLRRYYAQWESTRDRLLDGQQLPGISTITVMSRAAASSAAVRFD